MGTARIHVIKNKTMGNIFQWLGQFRHAFTFVAGALVTFGIIKATNGEIETAGNLLEEIIKQTTVLVGLITQFGTMVWSWKESVKEKSRNSIVRTYEVINKIEFNLGIGLSDLQLESVYCIVRNWRRFDKLKNRDRLAYILATAWHESRLEPIREKRFREHKVKQRKNQDRYWLTGFFGRGYVQLTWLHNYRKQSSKIGIPLHENPSLALQPSIAAEILVRGMLDGDFTGLKLSRYINHKGSDFLNARRVVNGIDRRELISSYANKFK